MHSYAGFHNVLSACRIRIDQQPGRTPVIIATKLPDNPGTSITNLAEQLCAEVLRTHLPARFEEEEPVIWVEHYTRTPDELRRQWPEFARVAFHSPAPPSRRWSVSPSPRNPVHEAMGQTRHNAGYQRAVPFRVLRAVAIDREETRREETRMTSQAVPASSALVHTAGEPLTSRQLVALYLVLAPLPGGLWLRRLVRRHPAQAQVLRDASRVWAQAGSKQQALRQLATLR